MGMNIINTGIQCYIDLMSTVLQFFSIGRINVYIILLDQVYTISSLNY